MALRVLLADESTTIKKVMQLALQDFAVEVKAVHAGVDVVEVARTFKPDLIFIDVLLQKKNGYEVGADLKKDSELKSIPIVLMWSSFMDLDENLAQSSGADRRLEKPFDSQQLRKIVLDLVPRTRSQRLAHFLDFPATPKDPVAPARNSDTPPPLPKSPAAAPTSTTPLAVPPSTNWNMDSFEDMAQFSDADALSSEGDEVEEFAELRIAPQVPVMTTAPDDSESWSHQDLSRFQIVLPATSVQSDDIKIDIQPNHDLADHNLPEHDLTEEKPEPTLTGVQGLSLGDYSADGALSVDIDDDLESETDRPVHNFGEELSLVESIDEVKLRQELREQQSSPRRPPPPGEPRDSSPVSIPSSSPSSSRPPPPTDLLSTNGPIPQMGVDRLEAILQAQSREIIEAFVRRVLPDLASDIIRAELQRLLEEGAE